MKKEMILYFIRGDVPHIRVVCINKTREKKERKKKVNITHCLQKNKTTIRKNQAKKKRTVLR